MLMTSSSSSMRRCFIPSRSFIAILLRLPSRICSSRELISFFSTDSSSACASACSCFASASLSFPSLSYIFCWDWAFSFLRDSKFALRLAMMPSLSLDSLSSTSKAVFARSRDEVANLSSLVLSSFSASSIATLARKLRTSSSLALTSDLKSSTWPIDFARSPSVAALCSSTIFALSLRTLHSFSKRAFCSLCAASFSVSTTSSS